MIELERTLFAGLDTDGPVVKICGISTAKHALHSARAGADMLGFVFAESRRRVTPDAARAIVTALREAGHAVMTVGVFVNEGPEAVCDMADYAGLDVVQLSGDEPYMDVWECMQRYPVLKAIRFRQGTTREAARRKLREYRAAGLGRLQLLVDAYHPGYYGGTGVSSDWTLAAQLARSEEIMLAGGLTPANVAQAVASVQPWGVDVSSGVEQEGVKSPELISAFVDAVRMLERSNVGTLRAGEERHRG